MLVDVGTLNEPTVRPDVSRAEVLADFEEDSRPVLARADRGECMTLMSRAAARYVGRLAGTGKIQGIISLGGGGGTAIATAAMRSLPIGFPKVMVSTLASGNVAAYVGVTDIVMIPAVVDVAGINRISRVIFENAAGAICGMVKSAEQRRSAMSSEKPVVVASMFGHTTACVDEARRIVEEAGYEVIAFHATGMGGKAMESLIASGLVAGVLDITTTEWADELVGGILTAGPERLNAAAAAGVPTIIVPGCLDMVNFGAPETVPAKFSDRIFYQHNPQVTLMRTNSSECAQLGRILADKINVYRGKVTVLWPLKGLSFISSKGQPFYLPAADAAMLESLKCRLRKDIPLIEMDCEINDPAFARTCAERLLENLNS